MTRGSDLSEIMSTLKLHKDDASIGWTVSERSVSKHSENYDSATEITPQTLVANHFPTPHAKAVSQRLYLVWSLEVRPVHS